IENSLLQWTGSAAALPDLLANPEVKFDQSRALEQIANQRWVHLFMHGYEAWAEYRRTGYPNNFVKPNGVDVPNRLSYPDNESFNNRVNFDSAVQSQFGGEDSIYGKLWWAK